MKKTRVLVFTNNFLTGGTERQAVELVKRLDRSRFEPFMACFRKEGPFIHDLPPSMDVHLFPLTSLCNSTAVREGARFLRFLHRTRVEVVQSFDFYANLFAVPLARLAGVRVVLACRRDEGIMRSPAHQKAERWAYRMATGVVANARAIKDQLVSREGLRPGRVWAIHNGLDLAKFDQILQTATPPPKEGAITVAVVANLRPEKGHRIFLDAVEKLLAPLPHVQFLIVGDGILRHEIEAEVKNRGLSDRVRMTGMVNPVAAILKAIDVVVLPSLSNEGLPNSVMEAMAAGLPVVATSTGGTGELVLNGLTGYLVPPNDARALAGRIATLCRNRDLRQKMGLEGRRLIVEQFTADLMARRFETLFDDLLGRA